MITLLETLRGSILINMYVQYVGQTEGGLHISLLIYKNNGRRKMQNIYKAVHFFFQMKLKEK